jgi:LuxR family transcriptional regulator, maltose regulon positive regulatory protein
MRMADAGVGGGDRLGVPRVKTAVPRVSPAYLRRPRLLKSLDAAGPGQTILVCAPAGYGKTLLLADWAGLGPERTAWVSVDDDDNDDRRFWSAVLTALAFCLALPDGNDLRGLAVPSRPSHDHEFLATVFEAIDSVPSAIRLILDDVHELTAPDPLHGLSALVRDHPPGLQLILTGRTDPPLPLGRMRLHGQLCEIRAEQLRFTLAEAQTMLAAAEVVARPDQVHLLVAQTEGWPAGLRLAALSLRGSADPDRFLSDFVGNSRAISDYLVSEILDRLSAADRELLGAVSVCDQLSAPLAAALSGRPDAGAVLDTLERETSLVMSTGDGRIWYRVHPLLLAHLRADLNRRRPDLVADLHGRAADWYAEANQPLPALTQARQSDDPARVVLLLHRYAFPLIGNGQLRVVREALEWLRAQGRDDAWQAMVAVLVDLETGHGLAADNGLQRAEALWPADPPTELVALRERVRARLAIAGGDVATTVGLPEPGAEPGSSDPALAIMGRLDRAMAFAMTDRTEEALRTALPAVDRARALDQRLLVAQGLTVLAFIAGRQGDYRRMTELAESADRGVPANTEWATTGGAALTSMLRAFGALMRGEPDACRDLVAVVRTFTDSPLRPRVPEVMVATCLALHGAALVDIGRGAEGLEDLRAARDLATRLPPAPDLIALVALLEHHAAWLAGRPDLARTVVGWAERYLGETGEVALLRARRLSELGRHQAAGEALALLLAATTPTVVPWTLVEAWVLDCRLALLADRPARARRSLGRALELTETLDVRRPLASGPDEVADLLVRHLGGWGTLDATAQRVLAARHALGTDRLPIALTDREWTVLRLLPSPRSFGEIATDLAVSHSTVKTHVRAIYSKLNASSRRQAIDVARRHGLLHPDLA